MITIQANYKGVTSSKFKNGELYILILYPNSNMLSKADGSDITPYKSLHHFLMNWGDIIHRNEKK